MSYSLAPDIFCLLEGGKILLWNCQTHEQFLLDLDYFVQLLQLNSPEKLQNVEIISDLEKAGIITSSPKKGQAEWGWDILSRLFHVGTKDVESCDLDTNPQAFVTEYLIECDEISEDIPHFFQEKQGILIDLPEPNLSALDIQFDKVLNNRKTCRNFNSQEINLQQMSDLLYASFGLMHGSWEEQEKSDYKIAGIRKSSPSSGGLHAEEAYIVVFRVTDLEPGLYYYRPQDHKLNLLKSGFFEKQVIEFNKRQFYSEGLALGIYITARLDKYWWKYKHSRTYRAMLLDIGHVSQTCLLVATALGLQTWISAFFEDTLIEEFLGIDGYTESIIEYVGIGHGDNQAFPPIFFNKDKK